MVNVFIRIKLVILFLLILLLVSCSSNNSFDECDINKDNKVSNFEKIKCVNSESSVNEGDAFNTSEVIENSDLNDDDKDDTLKEDQPEYSDDCLVNLDNLFSTGEITLIEGPLNCESNEGMLCGIYKVIIESPNTPNYPVENPGLDDLALPIEAILVVRTNTQQSFCDNRWVVFDAGGYGQGYANTFGSVLPGKFEEGGKGYGDDLIMSYTKKGYVTVDLMFEHPNLPPQGLKNGDPHGLSLWAKSYNYGRAWFRNLNNASFLGSASRSRAVYDWAYQNSGNNKICAHAQSSGSGRLIGALTRLDSEDMFDTIVFDGGPVFSYMPWICAIDDGELGSRPEEYFDISVVKSSVVTSTSISCAHTVGDNENSCNYDYCFNSEYDPLMLEDSFFVTASDRDFPDIDIGIVMGGADKSNAFINVMLWLGGYSKSNGDWLSYITAKSITLKQGYCGNSDGDYLGMFPCSNWDNSNFPSITNLDTYDNSIINTGHALTEVVEGMNIVQEIMLDNCELEI